MANRFLLNSSHFVASSPTTNSHEHFRFKALLFTLALVGCFISTRCASYHRSLVSPPVQWRERDFDYRTYSLPAVQTKDDESFSVEDLFSRSPNSLLEYQPSVSFDDDKTFDRSRNSRQQVSDYDDLLQPQHYYSQPAEITANGHGKLYDYYLNALRGSNRDAGSGSIYSRKSSDGLEPEYGGSSGSGSGSATSPPSGGGRLADLLREDQTLSRLDTSLGPIYAYDTSPEITDQLDSSSLFSPSNILLPSVAKPTDLTADSSPQRISNRAGLESQLFQSDREQESRLPKEHGNLTTLLEDENLEATSEADTEADSAPKASGDRADTGSGIAKTLTPIKGEADKQEHETFITTTASYGTIVETAQVPQGKKLNVAEKVDSSSGSLFRDMLEKVASFFRQHFPVVDQTNDLQSNGVGQNSTGKLTSKDQSELDENNKLKLAPFGVATDKRTDLATESNAEVNQANTKQGVSKSTEDKSSSAAAAKTTTTTTETTIKTTQELSNSSNKISAGSSSEEINSNDKPAETAAKGKEPENNDNDDNKSPQMVAEESQSLSSLSTKVMSNSGDNEDDNNLITSEDLSDDKSNQRRSVFRTISVQAPGVDEVEIKPHFSGTGDHKISLLRQSSLLLPLKTDDELLVRTTASAGEPSHSLLGKYVYVPEHHYHLNGADISKDNEQMFAHMTHRSYSRRLQPGEDVYSSYRPIYSHQRADEPLGLAANKTNDIYFLVMVGAFCAMAMAVVLAAGLFAYRVQQNRKSSSETDYPTYGVVGPSNMNGKCGAASFVGGYFASAGPSSPGSKAGSGKHLAENYSISDSGLGGSGKSVGKKVSSDQGSVGADIGGGPGNRANFVANQNVARMYHYQHQKQQMIISDRASNGRHTSASDLDSEDEGDDGSYTVYECPGLASAHEMEIKNPLFNDDRTP